MSLNLDNLVDKDYRGKSISEILAAPPSALLGLSPKHDEALAALKIKSVGDLGAWQHAVNAQALVTLAHAEAAQAPAGE
ncbi:hypothetical protein [Myceligenerans salitolerans]|uniref:Uncharacterized protein n=1 Tax=Myceligenerans salitolerans TaxID=1230528 RepID=A0ABS3IC01_9MICO|nr:hypothetical protein [Myceligenerans salitolerans]MBO0610463.1 hypothetical protein [Myceligenerans salitolerans]